MRVSVAHLNDYNFLTTKKDKKVKPKKKQKKNKKQKQNKKQKNIGKTKKTKGQLTWT